MELINASRDVVACLNHFQGLRPGPRGGDQLVAVAVPATGQLHLRPAADVLQQLTGWIDPPAAETAEETGTGGRSRSRSRVKAPFRPAPAGPEAGPGRAGNSGD